MEIYGLNKTTLLDYPKHVAATVFTGGCNFRCPFCHNGGLVAGPGEQSKIPQEEVISFLDKRRKLLEGVCITGGEPTLQRDIVPFVKTVKDMGYLVKLDTNGYKPRVLKELLEEGLLDYVAMDIKASEENYCKASGIDKLVISQIQDSIALLKAATIEYEFRTTVVKGIHTVWEFEKIGQWLKGSKAYYLQQYRESPGVLCEGYEAFSKEVMEEMRQLAAKYIDNVWLRGVE